jgi:hypothetical protein
MRRINIHTFKINQITKAQKWSLKRSIVGINGKKFLTNGKKWEI